MAETTEQFVQRTKWQADYWREIARVIKELAELIFISSILAAAASATGDRWLSILAGAVKLATVAYVCGLGLYLNSHIAGVLKPRKWLGYLLIIAVGVAANRGINLVAEHSGEALLKTAFARAT